MTRIEELIAGLQIVAKYPHPSVDAQHDIIYALASDVSEEDKKFMLDNGWHWEDEYECFGFFT